MDEKAVFGFMLIGFEETVVASTDVTERRESTYDDDDKVAARRLCSLGSGTWIGYGDSLPLLEDEVENARAFIGENLAGRYVITDLLGAGSSGIVYQAISTQIPRPFAVKVVHTGSSPGMRARFDNEVSALSRLTNPHIVQIADVVELEDGYSALVMERVAGVTLYDLLIETGALPVERVLTVARQLATALAAIHGAGMTHGDLKPENVMVEDLPLGGDFIRLLDFDIVQFSGQPAAYDFAGTPRYASPEQARGESLDPTSDIYSFGAVLFTMLTGRPPFGGDVNRELLRQHLESTPPRLPIARPDLRFPTALEDLVARMLDKEANRRPQSMAEVISMVEQVDAQITVEAAA